MALKLLFDIPEEVVLRQEEWGTQSQELPALHGTQAVGSVLGSCCRSSELQALDRYRDSCLEQAVPTVSMHIRQPCSNNVEHGSCPLPRWRTPVQAPAAASSTP